MIDYTLGFKTSLIIASVPVILIVLIGLVNFIAKTLFKSDTESLTYIFSIYFISIAVGLLLLVYPVLNMALQSVDLADISFIKRHISYYTLRCVSMILGLRIIWEIVSSSFSPFRSKNGKQNVDLSSFDKNGIVYNFERMFQWYVLTQFILYGISIGVLFYLEVKNVQSILLIILNLLLFYVVDDWNIIKQYADKLRGRVIKYHAWYIELMNASIGILTLVASIMYIGWIFSACLLFFYVLVFIWREHSYDS